MILELRRQPTVKDTTLGTLTIDGVYQCDTLEDVVREVPGQPVHTWKLQGMTAIPVGTYRVYLADSPKFGPDTLSLESVPGFTYIRIHAGNDDADTEGCILVGTAVPDPEGDGGNVKESRAALTRLKGKLVPVIKSGELVYLTVRNPSVIA
jgi:hypothetical protein